MSISYEYYKIFYYTALYRNFSRTAAELHNSQPNITRIINNLENALGCKLFTRSNKGLTLTPDGEKLFYYVNSAHKLLQMGEHSVMKNEVTGAKQISLGLSIGISRTILYDFLLPILKDFDTRYPDVIIKLYNNSAPNLIFHTREGLYDMALLTDTDDNLNGIKKRVLGTFSDIIIGGPSYEFLSRKTVSMEELEKHPLIILREGTETYAYYRNWFIQNGLGFAPRIETASLEQVLSFVKKDMGLGFIFPKYADSALENKEVFKIKTTPDIPKRQLTLIRSTDVGYNIYADALEDMIELSRYD